MTNLQVFLFDTQPVRIVGTPDDPWWVAKDVCDVLDIDNVSQALRRLDDDEKNTITINDGIPGNPNLSIISESGLYSLIFTSRKPEAKRFKKWVTSEVLPAIRKTGSYNVHSDDPKLLIEREKTERERVKVQARLDELRLKHELKLAELEHKQQSKSKVSSEKLVQLNQRSRIALSDEILKLVSDKDRVATRWIVDSLVLRYGIKADTPRDRKNLELIIKKVLQQNGWIRPKSGRVTVDGKQDRGYERPKHLTCYR